MINQTSVDRLKAYALANYNSQGWDYLIECWTDAEIVEHAQSEGWETYPDMLNGFADMFGAIYANDIEVNLTPKLVCINTLSITASEARSILQGHISEPGG